MIVCAATGISLAALVGAFNGLLVTKVGLPSLAVTIGTLTLYRGIAIVILGPQTVSWGSKTIDGVAYRGFTMAVPPDWDYKGGC